ncbi:hypothetical protein AVEN_212397-1 [Araneus ventricosus]|uniref:Uncharacterized protein n=1 Tax=Araneus ventricosus TaxID=182803 RepID=A0A4Y2VAJ3_ARAVE|nr:hypothetical protein AVEN_212397-1 [Araneus ventricosus]
MPLYNCILLYLINPILHKLVRRLSPRWFSPGLAPFFGRPGQCGYFCTRPTLGRLAPYVLFNVKQAQYTTDLQWNRVSNLESSVSKAENLPLGHRGGSLSCAMLCFFGPYRIIRRSIKRIMQLGNILNS